VIQIRELYACPPLAGRMLRIMRIEFVVFVDSDVICSIRIAIFL